MCVKIGCVELTCSEAFQKTFLIFMSGSVHKVENAVLVCSLAGFSSVVNTLENEMGSAGPWHAWGGCVHSFSDIQKNDLNYDAQMPSTEFDIHGVFLSFSKL